LPAIALPAVDPGFDAILDVLRVGMDFDLAATRQRLQRANDGGQFHAIVGGVGFAAEELALAVSVEQQRAPAAGTGIALAGPVRVDHDGRHSGERWEVVMLSRARAAGASALRRSRRSHAGVSSRNPSTLLVARRKYTPPAIGHQRSPAASR